MNGYKKFIQKNALPLVLSAFTLLTAILNAWLGSKLVPFARDIRDLDFRVSAIEERNDKIDPLIPRFITVEEHIKNIDENIKDIKESHEGFDRKLDEIRQKAD